MAINKKLIHFKTYANFSTQKLSANEANTQYTVGIDGEVTTGSPDILYQSICWIKDTQQMWTHGQIYNASDIDLSNYVTLDGTEEITGSKTFSGQTMFVGGAMASEFFSGLYKFDYDNGIEVNDNKLQYYTNGSDVKVYHDVAFTENLPTKLSDLENDLKPLVIDLTTMESGSDEALEIYNTLNTYATSGKTNPLVLIRYYDADNPIPDITTYSTRDIRAKGGTTLVNFIARTYRGKYFKTIYFSGAEFEVNGSKVPTNTSDLTNDSGFASITEVTLDAVVFEDNTNGGMVSVSLTTDQIANIGAAYKNGIVRVYDSTGAYVDMTFAYYGDASDWTLSGTFIGCNIMLTPSMMNFIPLGSDSSVDTSNFVDLTSIQSISALKSFSNGITTNTINNIDGTYQYRLQANGQIGATNRNTGDNVGYMSVDNFATCTTAASTVAKVATLTKGIVVLTVGMKVSVKFTYAHTATSMTLNVNSTGVKTCQFKGTAVGSGLIVAGGVYDFVYDGTYWQLLGGVVPTSVATATTANNAYNPLNYGTCSTAAATAAKTVTLSYFTLVAGKQIRVKFTYANTASTPTLNVNSTGAKPMYFKDGTQITSTNFAFNTELHYLFTYSTSIEGVTTGCYVLENHDSAMSLGRENNIPVYFSVVASGGTPEFHTANGEAPRALSGGVFCLTYSNATVSQAIPLAAGSAVMMPVKVASIVTSASGNVQTWVDVKLTIVLNSSTMCPVIAQIYDSAGTQLTSHNLANIKIQGHLYGMFK